METVPTRIGIKTYPVKYELKKYGHQFLHFVKALFIEKGVLFYIVGLLLGRAVILSGVSPFAVAFLATLWVVHRRNVALTFVFILLGALSYSMAQGIFIFLSLLVFILLANLFKQIKAKKTLIPLFVFFSTVIPRLFLYSLVGQLTAYEWLLLGVEGILATVLVLIFMQSLPLLSLHRYKKTLKNEEIVCLIILIASILTGMVGWSIYDVSIEQVFSRYFVLSLAFVGGAAIGSTVGVVAGLILSLAYVANLYQMSLLAFSGLLGGLLKEGRKIGVSLGMIIGTCLVSIYSDATSFIPAILESSVAILLFFITPASWFKRLSRYVPGTTEYTNEQKEYLQKVRHVTAERVEQFSNVFKVLANSFIATGEFRNERTDAQRETDYFLSHVTEKTCQHCFMKERCWKKSFDQTYSLMERLKESIKNEEELPHRLVNQFSNHCVKSKKVIETMYEEMSVFDANTKLKKQVLESKRLVADQLQGVSEVMDRFAQEILKEREHHEKQEMEIMFALQQIGIELEQLEVYQLEKGNIDIEMTVSFYDYRGEGPKLIAPILSEILKENVIVKKEEISPFPNGYSRLAFGSAKEFVVETGIAHAAKGGGLISGDSFKMMEIGIGKHALAISDGMGNGLRAKEESEETLKLLQQILQTGMSEKIAIKSINSILSLRTTDEMFATLDLAVINLHNAHVRFLKVGSIPSFIKRNKQIKKIEASNLPIGIIQDVDVEMVNEQLKAGDYLFMMSDGVFEGPKHIRNTELWFKRKIKDIETEDPQAIADLILEEVIRTQSGQIEDDMTVLVAKIKKNKPKWTTIPIYNSKAQ